VVTLSASYPVSSMERCLKCFTGMVRLNYQDNSDVVANTSGTPKIRAGEMFDLQLNVTDDFGQDVMDDLSS